MLNRKMAKKYYENQLQQKMLENKTKADEQIEKKKKDLLDKDAKKEKTIAELRKQVDGTLKHKIRERKMQEEDRRMERAK